MKKFVTACIVIGIGAVGAGVSFADEDQDRGKDNEKDKVVIRDAVQRFATLPDGVRHPEGITANPANGDIYASTFDAPPGNNPNKLLRWDRNGKLVALRDFGNEPLLGLDFDRHNQKVYVLNVGAFAGGKSRVQRIAANFSASTVVEDVAFLPSIGAPTPRTVANPDGTSDTITFGNVVSVPNAMVFDSHGNLYVSDSFQGAIFRVDNAASCKTPCPMVTVAHDPLLATAGFPPFGANGLALSGDESVLFIANTGDDRVLALTLGTSRISVFTDGIDGADGLAVDGKGRLWVAANQADTVFQLNEHGRVVGKVGEFRGIRADGTPDGLLFPASMVFVGDSMFVTNLAIALTPAIGDEPEEDVTRWTLSRVKVPGL